MDMKIDFSTKNSFKGYDARQLKGFLMTYNCQGIAEEMSKIAKKENFKIFSPFYKDSKWFCAEALPPTRLNTNGLWAQDLWTFVKGKILALEYTKTTCAIKDFFNLKYDFTEKIAHETANIVEKNQNIWDLYDELKKAPRTQERDIKEISRDFEAKKKELYALQDNAHIKGGNVFVVKGDKNDEVIIGKDELKKFSIDEIKSMYNVDKVTVLPQMDFHLDLFIRPLDNKRVLLTDDNVTIETLKSGFEKLYKKIATASQEDKYKYKDTFAKMVSTIKCFIKIVESNTNTQADETAKILEENGFEVIRVPGRIYETEKNKDGKICLKHLCNYMNANVIKNEKDDIIYITNKSKFDKQLGLTRAISKDIGFSFEDAFKDSISKYVKKSKVYFIKGKDDYVANEMLKEYQGGIHCACAEVP